MQSFILGKSRLGLPIFAHRFGGTGPRVLLIAATHGDEVEGVALTNSLMEEFLLSFPFRLDVVVVPEFNVDGVLLKQRWNAADVDLNRNLPTKDWTAKILNPRYPPGPSANSEPENQALTRFLSEFQPRFVFNFHSYHPCLAINGDCREEAELLKTWTGSPILEDIGYPTPGCFGTYAGLERNMPTITYEIERGMPFDQVIRVHRPAMIEVLKLLERKFEDASF